MEFLNNLFGIPAKKDYGVQFWESPEKTGWLYKQGEHIKSWRRRFFVMKGGKIFWFQNDLVTPDAIPRGVIDISTCLSIKGAEDVINKPYSFEIATVYDSLYYMADNDKEKEDWINAIGKAIVKHSKSLMDKETSDYTR